MRSAWSRSLSPSLAPIALALVGGGLSYWSAARTPIRHVSSSLNATIESLTALFAVCAAALAVLGALSLLDALDRTPAQARRCAKLAAGLPLWLRVLPIALSASLLATRISLTAQPRADYWPAFWLWLGAMTLLVAAFLPGQWWERLRFRFSRPTWSGVLQSEAVILALVAAVALALRMSKLDAAPFLLNGDEESMGAEALNVTAGKITNMFATAWEGVPTMVFFTDAAAFKVFGTGVVAIRMVSALIGAAAVVVTYLLLREMFGRGPALVGALFMAGYDFHLHFSRAGLVNVDDTLVAASALYFAYKASRDHKAFDFAALGIICGLGLYIYSTTRVVTLIVIAYLVYISIFQRGFLRASFGKMGLTVTAFGVAAMPLGAYFLTAPQTFAGRLGSVGLFQSGWYDQQLGLGRSQISIFWDQALHAFGGFVHYPVSSNVYLYDTPHPLISGLAVVPFIAGFVYSVFHIEKKEYGLLLIALAVPAVVGGILTVPPTAWQRYLETIPAISGLVAVGLWQLADRLLAWRRSLVPLAAFPAVIFLAAQNIDLYFQAAVADVRFGAPIRKVTVDYVDSLPQDTRVYWFGAPEVWGANLAGLSLRDRRLIDVFDANPQALPAVERPSPSVYLFMAQRQAELPALETKCPGGIAKVLSFRDTKVLTAYELSVPNTCVPTLEPPPANDKFANSTAIDSLPFSDTVSTKAAALDPGEPQPGPPKPGNQTPCGGVPNTAWYSFMPSADMQVVAQTMGSAADTLVAVYEGNELASLTPVACSAHLPDRAARVEFVARAGVPYHFQVAALSFSVGTVTFTLAQSSSPPASEN
jgi:hypothetical protein